MTAKQLIRAALRQVGAIEAGADPTPDDITACLECLNNLLNSWWAEGLPVWSFSRETFTLVAGTASYTIGTSGDFNTARPVEIDSAYVQYPSSDELYPVDIVSQLSYDSGINTTQGRPYKLFYNPAYPLGKIYLAYIPDTTYTLQLNMKKRLGDISSEGSSVSVPEEYNRAIIFNLALDISGMYGFDPSSTVVKIARDSRAAIDLRNSANMPMDAELDPRLFWRRGGITKGEYDSGL